MIQPSNFRTYEHFEPMTRLVIYRLITGRWLAAIRLLRDSRRRRILATEYRHRIGPIPRGATQDTIQHQLDQ